MMTINLFVIANVKQLRTDSSFRILLSFFRTSVGVGVLNSAIFNRFHNRVEFGTILGGLRNFLAGGGGLNPPPPLRPPVEVKGLMVFPFWDWGGFTGGVGLGSFGGGLGVGGGGGRFEPPPPSVHH